MRHVFAVLAAVGLVWAFMPQVTVVPVRPVTPQSPVTAALSAASSQDKARVTAFYSAMADVVERDAGVIPTVGDFRTLHARSLDLAFKGTDLPGKYPGLDVAVNDRMVAAVGKDDVPLSQAKRQALVQALKDVSNAAR